MPTGVFNHPIAFAAVAVIAIGIAVYQFVSGQNEKKQRHGNGRPPPKPPSSPESGFGDPPKPSKDSGCGKPPPGPQDFGSKKSDSKTPAPLDRDNSVRRRNNAQTKPKQEYASDDAEHSLDGSGTKDPISAEESRKGLDVSSSSKEQNELNKFDEAAYRENVLNKIANDAKKLDKDVDSLVRNILEEDSDSSESNIPKKSTKKIINKHKSAENLHCLNTPGNQQVDSNSNPQSPASLSSEATCDQMSSIVSDSSDLVSISDSEELLYKEKLREAVKADLKKEKLENTPGTSRHSSGPSVASNGTEVAESSHLHNQSNWCKGCEENHVNTRAHPCNHRYLCLDCAIKIFRLYKKCSICYKKVTEFVLIDS